MSPTRNPAAEIAAVQQRFLQHFAHNDLAGLAACYTEDAQMLVANMEVIAGRSAIASVFKFTAVKGHTLDFKTHELEVHEGVALEVGRYTRRRNDGSTFDLGKYMVVWKRVADGWLIHRDMFSTSLAKTPSLAPA
jgi:ketosteroid isomerase-like protein